MTFSSVVCVLLALCAAVYAASSRPNFIVILADDVGVGDLHHPTIRRPNLDKLRFDGMEFTQFYSSAPLCSPSRASLLAGRLPVKLGVYTNTSWPLDQIYRVFLPTSLGCMDVNATTLPHLLSTRAGYFSALVGKWHLGTANSTCMPTSRGFDYYYGLSSPNDCGFPGPDLESAVFPPVPLMQNTTIIEQPVDLDRLTPRYTEQVLAMLDMVAGKEPEVMPEHPISPGPAPGSSFFLYLAYAETHVPLFAAPPFQNKSRRGHYGDAFEAMDASIGQIMAKLNANGLADNTYVIFTSDNGAWIDPGSGVGSNKNPLNGGSNGMLRGGKGSTWEGGVREPGLIKGPGITPGSTVMDPVTMMDIMPTCLELAGLPVPAGLDGKSIVDVIHGNSTAPPHEFIHYWREHTLYAIRKGPWKAHFYTRPGFGWQAPVEHNPPLLFQVEEDPGEAFPVTDQPGIVAELVAAAAAHVNSTIKFPSQYEAQSYKVVPCCDKGYNKTQAEHFIEEGKIGLAIWDNCVCSNATTRPLA